MVEEESGFPLDNGLQLRASALAGRRTLLVEGHKEGTTQNTDLRSALKKKISLTHYTSHFKLILDQRKSCKRVVSVHMFLLKYVIFSELPVLCVMFSNLITALRPYNSLLAAEIK